MKTKGIAFILGLICGVVASCFVLCWNTGKQLPTYDASTNRPEAEVPARVSLPEVDELRATVAKLTSRIEANERASTIASERDSADKARYLGLVMKKYTSLFVLTPGQRELIGDLEWEARLYWQEARAGKVDTKKDPPPSVEKIVASILTPEQMRIYEQHQEQDGDARTQVATIVYMGRIPATLDIPNEQRDRIYHNLYLSLHPRTQQAFQDRWRSLAQPEFTKVDQTVIWAAEGILSAEQISRLKESMKVSSE